MSADERTKKNEAIKLWRIQNPDYASKYAKSYNASYKSKKKKLRKTAAYKETANKRQRERNKTDIQAKSENIPSFEDRGSTKVRIISGITWVFR